jgi:hypothetical protein
MRAIPVTGVVAVAVVALLTACAGGSATGNSAPASAPSTTSPDKQAELDYQALRQAMDTLTEYTSQEAPTVSTVNLDEVKGVAVADTKNGTSPAAAVARDLNFILGASEHGPRAFVLADNGGGWWAMTAAVPNPTRPYAFCLRVGDIPNGGGARNSGFVYTPPLAQGACAAADG